MVFNDLAFFKAYPKVFYYGSVIDIRLCSIDNSVNPILMGSGKYFFRRNIGNKRIDVINWESSNGLDIPYSTNFQVMELFDKPLLKYFILLE